MPRAEAAVEIERAPADVFPWLVDPEKRLRWVRGLVESAPAGDGRYEEVMEAGGRRVRVTSTIDRLDEPRALTVALKGSGISARAEHRLDDLGGRTRITSSLDLRLSGLLRFAGGIASQHAQRQLQQSLTRLKELLEAEAPPP